MSAQILQFTGSLRNKPAARKGPSADAEPTVVILPCVRYERWDGDPLEDARGETSPFVAAAHH